MKYTDTLFDTIGSCVMSIFKMLKIDGLEDSIKKFLILIISFLSPVVPAIFAVYFLIFLDLITGVWAAIKQNQEITSGGLSRTIGKILIYSTTIIMSYVVHKYLFVGFDFPIESLVSGFIAITETKSILENINKISKNKAIKDLIIILSNERSRRLPTNKNDNPN